MCVWGLCASLSHAVSCYTHVYPYISKSISFFCTLWRNPDFGADGRCETHFKGIQSFPETFKESKYPPDPSVNNSHKRKISYEIGAVTEICQVWSWSNRISRCREENILYLLPAKGAMAVFERHKAGYKDFIVALPESYCLLWRVRRFTAWEIRESWESYSRGTNKKS